MKKNIKNFLGIFLLSFLFSTNIFAFSANISTNWEKFDINDAINLKIVMESDDSWDISISKIWWIENFEVLWKSQSQSSSFSTVVINWKTEMKSKISHILSLRLQAKKDWNFTIWPVEILNWQKKFKTNSLNLEISWKKMANIWLNWQKIQNLNQQNTWWFGQNIQQNVQQNIQAVQQNLQNNLNQNNLQKNIQKLPKKELKIENFENTQKKVFEKNFKNNEFFYLIFAILIIWILWIYFYWKNNPEFFEKIKKELKNNNKNKNNKENNENNENNEENFLKNTENKINFEEKILEYPEISDEKFLEKIGKIFNGKMKKNNFSDEEKNIIWELKNLLNKAKYSKFIWDGEKILDLIKKL